MFSTSMEILGGLADERIIIIVKIDEIVGDLIVDFIDLKILFALEIGLILLLLGFCINFLGRH